MGVITTAETFLSKENILAALEHGDRQEIVMKPHIYVYVTKYMVTKRKYWIESSVVCQGLLLLQLCLQLAMSHFELTHRRCC